MIRYNGALEYQAGEITTTGALAALDPLYADLDALRALAGCALLEFPERSMGAPFRADLTVSLKGTDGQQAVEALYVVRRTNLSGTPALLLEKAANITWTAGNVSVPTALGGLTSHVWPKAASLTATGLLAARSGTEVRKGPDAAPVVVTVFDPGSMVGLLRQLSRGTSNQAAAVAPIAARWS